MALKGIKSWFSRKSEPLTPVSQPQILPDPALSTLCIANIFHVGVPSDVTPTLAYDPFQGLLAVGTLSGLIKVYVLCSFAKEGLEVVLRDTQTLPIAHLAFHPNAGVLYAVKVDDSLVVWDLATRRVRQQVQLRFRYYLPRVTCLYATEVVPVYAYLGTSEGHLRVFNLEKHVLTTFCLAQPATESAPPAAVFALKLHPTDATTILIGYEGQPALIWSLKSAKCLRSLHFTSPINTIDWTADGLEVVAGLRDGNLAFWSYSGKETEPRKLMRVHSDLKDMNVSAVEKVMCASTGVLVQGGQPFAKEGSLSFLPNGEVAASVHIPLPAEPYSVVLAPLINGTHITDRAFILTEKCGLFSVPLSTAEPKPVYFQSIMGPGRVVKSCMTTVATDGNGVIDFVQGFDPLPDSTLAGGQMAETVTDCFGVLITAHDDALVHFWRVSKLRLAHFATISLQPSALFPYGNSQNLTYLPVLPGQTVTLLSFYLPRKLIVLGDHLGHVTALAAVLNGFQELFSAKVTAAAVLKVAFSGREELTAVFGDVSGNVAFANFVTGEVQELGSLADAKKGVKQNVLINDIVAFEELGIAAIGVSNGGLYLLNLDTLELTQSAAALNADLASETPKRSDFGILKLLPIVSIPTVLIVCYEKVGYTVELPQGKVLTGVSWPVPVFSAAINLFNTQAYLSTLDRTGALSLWSLPDLTQKWKSDTLLPLE